ncbi:hypothetical protein [Paenarthrobacter ilicis]|uniref:Uncharacterized protein n=1 Tax=Paenarthrobacter ilicis TaxID=43665 RepID=A0ABX0TGX9_9MICC|nr:hypothetical protein [Paenarthrobacter ilicis]MBM7793457.1 hypothetical protein [Paenarthrobacter ilicis]NIJ01767.1 hypothetical protein [Paenarthrobacter ilicis]
MSSQEQRPIRSRRELRRAREQQPDVQQEQQPGQQEPAQPKQEQLNQEPEQSAQEPARANGRNRRAANVPVDAVGPAAQERSSQTRARDRAALRTIKDLADKEEQLSGGGPPTRRQLRLQQLQAEVATSMNPIVPPAATSNVPVAGNKAEPAKPQPVASGESVTDAPAKDATDEADMSVEQALAVRELIAAQVQNQTAKLEHIAEQDPLAVDPEVLAQQIALAERAAVLNKRAAAKQKLAEQTAAKQGKDPARKAPPENKPVDPVPSASSSGPSTANNLAMVTPLEFVKMPGVERPVMKRPSTTFVPVITSAGPKLDSDGATGRKAPSRGRSGVLARAEAAARSARKKPLPAEAPRDQDQRPPISAIAAYGLDPLDAGTAGLARAQRNRLVQYGVLALGVVALIIGIIMITSG